MAIKIIKDKISLAELKAMAEESYGDMVKVVVDVGRNFMAVGGEWHADAEAELLNDGASQKDLWGINIYPQNEGEEKIVFQSLINIRPRAGNRSMVIENEEIRNKIKEILNKIIADD